MSKININVYTNMDNNVKEKSFKAIKIDSLIKYIDDDNHFVIDLVKNILIKENNESIIKLLFNDEYVTIFIKSLNCTYQKDMRVININYSRKYFSVKYYLKDDNIINEYRIEFV